MKIERTIDLEATPARVWTLLTEPDQIKRWITELVDDVPTTPPPHAAGTRTRMTIREGSRTVEYSTEILVFELHRELVLEMRGGSLGAHPMRISYRLEPHAGATRLTYRSSWRPSGVLLRLLLPLIILIGRRNLRRSLRQLAILACDPPRRLAHAT
jgi:uncharacterized protein YndB with AHSA1/START domain